MSFKFSHSTPHLVRAKGLVVPEHLRTNDQKILRLLLNIVISWAFLTYLLTIGYMLVSVTPLFTMLHDFSLVKTFLHNMVLPSAGFFVSCFVVGLGYRGMRNPYKISPFFAIIFVDALLIGWDLASQISMGVFNITYIIRGVLIILTAYYAWQVKKTTYPDDWFEQKEAAKAHRKQAIRAQKAILKAERAERRNKVHNS